jgi:5'-3' exonuclease
VYKAGWSVEKRYYTLEETSEVFKTKAEAKEKLIKEGREGEFPLLLLKSEVTGPESQAVRCLDNLYKSILEPFKGEHYVSYLSGPNNFRHEIAVTKPYKGNRPSSAKPYYYDFLRWAICDRYNGIVVDGIEADDRIAIGATAHDNCVIVGIDKDLLQIPGIHYNYDKGKFLEIDEVTGWYNFFTQALVGDVSDNIPGIAGIGPKKAATILAPVSESIHDMYTTCHNIYLETYKDNGNRRFDEGCGLLYLLRYENDNWADAREWLSRSS